MSIDDWDSFEIFAEDHHYDDVDDDDDKSFNLTPYDEDENLTPKKRVLTDDEEKKRRLRNRLSAHMSRVKQRNYIEFLKCLIEEKNAIIQFQKKRFGNFEKN